MTYIREIDQVQMIEIDGHRAINEYAARRLGYLRPLNLGVPPEEKVAKKKPPDTRTRKGRIEAAEGPKLRKYRR